MNFGGEYVRTVENMGGWIRSRKRYEKNAQSQEGPAMLRWERKKRGLRGGGGGERRVEEGRTKADQEDASAA